MIVPTDSHTISALGVDDIVHELMDGGDRLERGQGSGAAAGQTGVARPP